MADDEIEKLLRQIDGASGSSGEVAKPAGKTPVKKETKSGGGRVAFAVFSGIVLAPAAWCVGLILPFTSAVSAGIGGAFAAFVTALIAGPPRWFSS